MVPHGYGILGIMLLINNDIQRNLIRAHPSGRDYALRPHGLRNESEKGYMYLHVLSAGVLYKLR